ncbi:hypothetical protein BGZ80_000121 [Entomortierella chlamydospora]|uniref:Uncharacterized protein n=1 Tax=Entomortierella chlamydospora TaxID=101097 RepID=A0A9P6MSU2_9FUNG|nr:hypothetical protein BGZ80_000121 [Entomortierella chlamydospora]
MNLSQILNPPGSSTTTTGISSRQGRTSSTPPPSHSLSSGTTVLRFDTPLNGSTGGGTSRKHSSSVSVAQLEEQATYTPSTSKTTGGTYQKIKPNEISNGYSTHTFRANAPIQPSKETSTSAASNNTALPSIAPAGGTLCQLVMSHNTPQDMSSSMSAGKKKRRNNASNTSESSPFQDSFQSNPSDQHEATATTATTIPKKKASKKANQATQENESQPLEIRFVMTDKDDQDRQRNQKQALTSTPKDESPSQDSPGEDGANDFQSSPTPDFERNADGNGMILFIPQESSSATSSPSYSHGQSPSQSTTTTPSGAPRNEASLSLPSTPSGHASSGPTFVATGSVSPPLSEPTIRINEPARQSIKGSRPLVAQGDTTSGQLNSSTSRSPVASDSPPSKPIIQKNESSNNFSDDVEQQGAKGRDEHSEDNSRDVEEEDSDEMRQKEEAALTMTSFREMAMLQHHRPNHQAPPTAPAASPYHPSHPQQTSLNSDARRYSNGEYYTTSSYRDYPPSSYHPHSSNASYPTIPSSTSPIPSTGSHPHTSSHSGEYWKNSQGGATPKQDINGYAHHGQDHPQDPQRSAPQSGDNRYHHYSPHPSRSRSPVHHEPQYRGHANDHGYDRINQ